MLLGGCGGRGIDHRGDWDFAPAPPLPQVGSPVLLVYLSEKQYQYINHLQGSSILNKVGQSGALGELLQRPRAHVQDGWPHWPRHHPDGNGWWWCWSRMWYLLPWTRWWIFPLLVQWPLWPLFLHGVLGSACQEQGWGGISLEAGLPCFLMQQLAVRQPGGTGCAERREAVVETDNKEGRGSCGQEPQLGLVSPWRVSGGGQAPRRFTQVLFLSMYCSEISLQDFCGELFLRKTVLLRLWQSRTLHSALPPGWGVAEPGVPPGCQDEVYGDSDQEVPQVQGGHREGGGLPVHVVRQVSHRILLALSCYLSKVHLKKGLSCTCLVMVDELYRL